MGAGECTYCYLRSSHKPPPLPTSIVTLLRRDCAPVGREGLSARALHRLPAPRGSTCEAELWLLLGADWAQPGGRAGLQLSELPRRRRRIGLNRGRAAAGAGVQEPTGSGRDGAATAPRRTHALSGPKLGRASPAPPAAPIPTGMMCLECASAAAGGAEEEEADAERRRRRRGAQLGAGGGGCCGTRAAGAAGVAAADDEVQTLSGSVRRAPSGPPSTPSTPSCATAAKGPGAQQPKPASLGRGRGAAAAILSLGNVLNYLDRYTVAGELVPHPAREPGPLA